MPHVTFVSDIEKDMKNIWHKSNNSPDFGSFNVPRQLKNICENKAFEEAMPELKKYLSKIYDLPYIEAFIEAVQKLWNGIEDEFFVRMNKVIKKEYVKDIKCYITTIGICPYNVKEPSFMVSVFSALPNALKTSAHEIMHLYFHDFYWKDIEEKIGRKNTGDLKEALTMLLNLEFKDLWLVNDTGYFEHEELRNFIKQNWKEEKDFDVLLEKCIEYLK